MVEPRLQKQNLFLMELKKSISDEIPSRDGYNFLGWSTSKTAGTYTPGGAISITAATTLYAVWQQNTSGNPLRVSLIYNLNGGTGTIANSTGNPGATFKVSSVVPIKKQAILFKDGLQVRTEVELFIKAETQ